MKTAFKKTAVALIAMAFCAGSQAGFMDDFYTAAGAAANVTPAQVVSGQGGTYITGGSAIWRVPNKQSRHSDSNNRASRLDAEESISLGAVSVLPTAQTSSTISGILARTLSVCFSRLH